MKSEYKFGMIGPSVNEIERGIAFIEKNNKFVKLVKSQSADWDLLVSDEYVVYGKFNSKGKQHRHMELLNNMLDKNNFECKLYNL